MLLEELGWSPYFAHNFEPFAAVSLVPARIIRQDRNRYLVHDGSGPRPAVVAGRLLAPGGGNSSLPITGDWVALHPPASGDLAVIEAVLPRRSAFSRKVSGATTREQTVAANIDTLFIVMGLDGDFNPRRVERYAVQAWDSGATPVILLNKADVCAEADERVRLVEMSVPGVDVFAISAEQDIGLTVLNRYTLPGHTVALVGSSGVGKSTLANHLMGREHMRTRGVREDDSRGRHTTTHRELLLLPGGGVLIDTPGMRELQLWTSTESVDHSFADIETLSQGCRFRDCAHGDEPGCAVREALENGTLDAARYRSYGKLRRELAYLAQRQQETGDHEIRRMQRKGSLLIKQIKRHRPK